MGKAKQINHNSFNTIKAKEAYWLGMIAADGHVYSDKRYPKSKSIGLHTKDEELVNNFKNFLESEHKITKEKTGYFKFGATSKDITDRLETFGITERKSLTLEIKNIPKLYISHFMRGILDGDGSISCYKRPKNGTIVTVTITSGSKKFLEWINTIVPIKGKLYNNSIQIVWQNREKIIKLCKWLYNGSTVDTRLDRKYKKFKEILALKNYKHQPNRKLTINQVIEIRKKYKELKHSILKLSKEYNIDRSCIYNIINNKTYKEV